MIYFLFIRHIEWIITYHNLIDCFDLQCYYKLWAFVHFTLHMYFSTHFVNDILADAQAKTSSSLIHVLMLIEHAVIFEKLIYVFLFHAYSVVLDFNL